MNGIITKENIKNMIYEIREKQVILASDLAKLFECKNGTKEINQTLKRNKEKFSKDSYFQLIKEENLKIQNLSSRSQFVTLNNQKNNRGTNLKYLPFVFTKEGIEVLANILKSEKVKVTSKTILDAFNEKNSYKIIKKPPEIQGQNIRNMIYEINGKQVMLDEDLANLYHCKGGTKEINQAVKNNLKKFPLRYSWILSNEEFLNLRSKILTASLKNITMKRFNPRVFTEEGIYMLATILKTEIATEISMAIIDTFALMRHYLENNQNIVISINNINNKLDIHENKFLEINERLDKQDEKIEELFNSFKSKNKKEYIFMNGEVYDSYSKIIDIISEAKKDLIIIDNYADKSILDIISKLKTNVTLITKQNKILKNIDIKKYKKQYNNLNIIYNNDFHDRFIIIDNNIIYHLGTSLNHAGNKIFAINKIEELEIKEALMKKIKSIL